MKKNNFKSLILAFLALGLVFTSCNPDDDNGTPTGAQNNDEKILDTKTAVAMDATLSAVENFVVDYYDNKDLTALPSKSTAAKSSVVDCRSISFEGTELSGVVTVSFSGDCEIDGHMNSGDVSISYSYNPDLNEVELVYTFDNYFYDYVEISDGGTILIDYENERGKRERKHNFNITLTWPGGILTASREGELVREWVVLDLGDLNNSVAEITGGWTDTVGSFVSRIYDINPDSPLRYEVGCGYFVSGLVNIEHTNSVTREMYSGVLDFGTGECDRVSTLTLSDDTVITIVDDVD